MDDVDLLDEAVRISSAWREELDMGSIVADRFRTTSPTGDIDLVAVGKASREMASAAGGFFGDRVHRRLIISEVFREGDSGEVLVGEHPLPGEGSVAAGRALLDFLGAPTSADTTVFLVSGGASSLCVVPASPLTLADVGHLWDATVTAGFDITELNTLRAATSLLSGGAVLRHVRTANSVTLVLVDNAIHGAPWVASGLTYDHLVTAATLEDLLERAGVAASALGRRARDAAATRDVAMRRPLTTTHRNVVLAEPSTVLRITTAAAAQRGYHVVDLGSAINLEVSEAAAAWSRHLARASREGVPTCVVGMGEVIVKVRGEGRGGRCQEFAWSMMSTLADLTHEAVVVASSTDGRDFVEGVAGAYATRASLDRARRRGIDWAQVARRNDTYHGHLALGQLLDGDHSGWNLCDLYLALLR